jgi:hypothetical protein
MNIGFERQKLAFFRNFAIFRLSLYAIIRIMRARIFLFLVIFLTLFCSRAYPQNNGVKAIISPDPVIQGQSFSVKVFSSMALKSIKAKVIGQDIDFFRLNGRFFTVVGVPLGTTPGTYKIRLVLTDTKGATTEEVRNIVVKKGAFPKVSYWLEPSKTKLLDPAVIERGWVKIHEKLVVETPAKLWNGSFKVPTIGRISMKYGTRQVINGVPRDQHKGLDIAGMSNYRIRAGNSGKVALAEGLEAFGNTVVIDHGMGVYSMNFHMSRIDVKKGDIVEKGHILGLMGSTGVATGTHLHFAMSVHDVRVNPIQWLMNSALVE